MAITIRHSVPPRGKEVEKAGRRTIERASVASSPGVTDRGVAIVHVVVTAYSIYDVSHVAHTLTTSTADARAIAAKLIEAADKADRMAEADGAPAKK